MLHINDIFFTVQGEGLNSGRRALFVRMPFCNLACSWCDTSFNSFKKVSEEFLIEFARTEACRFAVITGGEPMLHKHTPRVIEILKSLDYEIACESNGTAAIVDGVDFATVSPKRDANFEIHPVALARASEFKYVVDEGFDFSILERHDLNDGRRYSLSPEFGNMQKSVERIMEFIRGNPSWRISLQTHKWMNIP